MKPIAEFDYLPKGFDLEPELRAQLSARPGNQRILVGHDELLLIVHEVPKPGVPEREPVVFWRTPGGGWFGPDGHRGLGGISALLDRFEAAVDEHEARIDEAENAAEIFKVARHAGPLARTTRNLVAALDHAVGQDEDERGMIGLRDRGREIERAAELLYHDAKLTLEFMRAERAEDHQAAAERLNEIAFRLNLMAGFFLPLVALGALLGMNVELPDFVQPLFWWVLWGGLGLGLLVVGLVSWKALRK